MHIDKSESLLNDPFILNRNFEDEMFIRYSDKNNAMLIWFKEN